MEKRLSQRQSGKLLAAAVASVGLAGFAASQSQGSLLIDVRGISVGGGAANGTIITGGKSVILNSVGYTVNMGVYARITGTNSAQFVTDISPDQDGSNLLTRNDDTLQSVVGSFQSVGLLKGNMAPNAGPVSTANVYTGSLNFAPFDASGKTNGSANDWDSDGDLDIGAVGTDPTQLFAARAAGDTQAAISSSLGVGTTGNVAANNFNANAGQESLINNVTNEVRIGSLRFVVTAAGGTADVNFVPRPGLDNSVAQWFEDNNTSGKFPGSSPGNFGVGAPVNISLVPEPATLGLLGVASLGLFGRRRNDKKDA